jgi:chromosome segregation ATPase
MRPIFFMLCIFLIILTTANAEEIIKCVDSNGNTILTSTPQDGMKCETGQPKEEIKNQRKSSTVNLIDLCNDLSNQLDDARNKMNEIAKQRSELNKELSKIREDYYKHNWNYDRMTNQSESINRNINSLDDQYSVLSQKQREINEDIELYKCNDLKNDLIRASIQTNSNDNQNRRYRK